MNPYIKGYHWPHMLFFFLSPLVAIGGSVWVASFQTIPWQTWLLMGILVHTAGMSITSGYHRLFAHKSYKVKAPLRVFFLLFGAAAFQGSARWWACGHRYHHKFVDTASDPYSIKKGFWYAHIGWLFRKEQDPPSFDWIRDLDRDPLIRIQAKLYVPLSIGMGWVLPACVASLWGDPWGGFFIAGLLRMVFNHHLTFCINSVCHYFGKQTYSDRHTARDHWVTALLTHGEGYHNFHHEFQQDYRNAVRSYQWDPTKWLIGAFEWMGLASDLRRVPRERILAAKLAMDQKRTVSNLATYSENVRAKAHEFLASYSKHIEEAHLRWMELREKYLLAKRKRLDAIHVSLEEYRAELKAARLEFRQALNHWHCLVRQPSLLATF